VSRSLVVAELTPPLFIVLVATVGLLASLLDFALYMTVTAFGLAVAVAALWIQELRAMPKLRIALFQRGLNLERLERAMEEPSRWATYSVGLFFLSGFAFAIYYLVPLEVIGGDAQPMFFLAAYMFALAVAYFLILFVCATRSGSAWAFDIAITISHALHGGLLFIPTLTVASFGIIPAGFLVATIVSGIQTGIASVPLRLWILTVPETLGVVGSVAIIWQDMSYISYRRRRFSNKVMEISIVLFLLPYLGYLVFLLPKWV
jgi:hypothetical protein